MHAFGTMINERKIGNYGDIICFSFDPVKIITSIDGGCVIVNTEGELHHLHHLRLLGIDKDTTERYRNQRAWDYDVVDQGFRYHLTNIMASIGVSQIKRVNEFIESRRKVCRMYSEAFQGIDGLRVPATDFSNVSPFIYSLRVLYGRREALIRHLHSLDIDIGIHFIPVHKHTWFANARHGDMTVTERATQEVVTLPLHSNMKPEFAERVIEGVRSFFA
jgi:dTDP-4-amino-4,6-dideoxygalactose transaminase